MTDRYPFADLSYPIRINPREALKCAEGKWSLNPAACRRRRLSIHRLRISLIGNSESRCILAALTNTSRYPAAVAPSSHFSIPIKPIYAIGWIKYCWSRSWNRCRPPVGQSNDHIRLVCLFLSAAVRFVSRLKPFMRKFLRPTESIMMEKRSE